ncbi:MAG: head GIN domain-containing protein [Candidatus Kapaibacteriales bacterium]
MQKFIFIALSFLAFFSLFNCLGVHICSEGSGIVVREKREILKFKTITINLSGNIFFYQADNPKIEIETDDNLHFLKTTEVHNSTLILDCDKTICPKKLNVYISNPFLEGLEINSSADFLAQMPIPSSQLSIQINGSSDIRIDSITTNMVNTQINGSGDISLGGISDLFISKINGSGELNVAKLMVKNAKINTNGSGDVYISVADELRCVVNGSGDIFYPGSPKYV